MIKLDVDEWCNNCNEFSPNVAVTEYSYEDFMCCRMRTDYDTVITCEHRNRCAGIKRYLEDKKNGNNN